MPAYSQVSLQRLLALVLLLAVAAPAVAQRNGSVPAPSYYISLEQIYDGDYRQAIRDLQQEVRGGIRIGQVRWVDSICHQAMLGEALFQSGNTRDALIQFDGACELFLSYPKWVQKVQFRQGPRPDGNPLQRNAPWGRSSRNPIYGILPDSMLVQQGEMITEQRIAQGGALQSLQMWRVDAIEVIRCTALAMRRRNEILGPLGKTDRMSRALADTLARGGLTRRGHWSGAWNELLLAIAQQGIGESQQALGHYARALTIEGRFDHRLTCAALYGQATLALEAGNAKAAMNLAVEASYSAFAYEDWAVLGDSFDLMHRAFFASGGKGLLAPLDVASQWVDRRNIDHLVAICRIAAAEQLVSVGQSKQATARLASISPRRRDLLTGRLGSWRRYVEAFIAYDEENTSVGDQAITDALALSRQHSLRNFQIGLTTARIDAGSIPSRDAVTLYELLLREPTTADWSTSPLETLTNITTSYEGALNRWIMASIDREKITDAIDIADQAKRRRFWLRQGIGGRLLAIRHLLETDPNLLPADAAVERRNLLLQVPGYEKLAEQAAAMQAELEAKQLADESGKVPSEHFNLLKRLEANGEQREAMVRRLAMRRDPTDMLVPKKMPAAELQQQLQQGQTVLVFHQSEDLLLAFVLLGKDYHHWLLPKASGLAQRASEMLRTMGHYTPSRVLDAKDLLLTEWEPAAIDFGNILFEQSRINLANTKELVIVPDGVLWHVPFEALMPSTGGNKQFIIDRTPVRYVPTMGYAAADKVPPRPIRASIVAGELNTGAGDFLANQAVEDLSSTAAGAVVIDNPVTAPTPLVASLAEQLIVLAKAELDPTDPYAFTPMPLDRPTSQGVISNWTGLPLPACERLVLGGVGTVAEMGLKTRGRSRTSAIIAGPELFHTSCSLLASGAKTVHLSRWQTSGKTHRDLLRELVLELPHTPANQAWQRSVVLARQTELDYEQEPRVKPPKPGTAAMNGDHPFMWSGYLLVDTGYDPAPAEAAE